MPDTFARTALRWISGHPRCLKRPQVLKECIEGGIVRAELVDGIVRVYTARGFAGVASVVGGIVRPRRLRAQMSSRPSAATDNLLES